MAAFLLGTVQGLTEFLPVSSSGHLVLTRAALPEAAVRTPGALFGIVVHLATLAAALIALRREVAAIVAALLPGRPSGERQAGRRVAVMLVVASFPAALAGFLLAEPIRGLFEAPQFASLGLVLTGCALLGCRGLLGSRRSSRGPLSGPARYRDALLIGTAPAVAILPGVSRSGATILTARARGLAAGDAARFSFLLSAPVIGGAVVFELAHAFGDPALAELGVGTVALELALGFVAAFLAGTLALAWVFGWLAQRRFHQFGWYCLASGGVGIGLSGA